MTCPFLSEMRVRSCSAAPRRKLIAATGAVEPGEKCGTTRHVECAVFQEKGGDAAGVCPHLEERLVQFCTAVSVPKYVPYSNATLTPCGSGSYRYCEAYRAIAGTRCESNEVREGVTVMDRLHYAVNHMWLDVGGGGLCHIGLDSLFARFLGTVDRVTFLTLRGVQKPAAVLTVEGVDWPIVFPSPMLIESADLHLRANPRAVTKDPHGSGWLFSGWVPPGLTPPQICGELLQGRRAAVWMGQEAQRLTARVSACLAPSAGGVPVSADGGSLAAGVAHLLSREHLLSVLNDFFSSHGERTWGR